jgi:hypothetical protein
MNKELRFRLAFFFLIVAMAIILVLKFYVNGFYEDNSPNNFPRFFYCIAFSFVGFSVLLFKLYFNPPSKENDFKGHAIFYVLYYLAFIAAIASLVFSLLHLSEKTNGYLFYFLAAPISFTFSFLIDDYINIARGIAKKATKSE